MSYANFKEAMELAKKCDFYETGKGISDEIIKKAEEELGIAFSRELYEYLREYSYMEFSGCEFYGITTEDFSEIYCGSIIEATISDRKEYGLPLKWIPILYLDDGYTAYLDYDNLNSEGEPRVIEGIYMGNNYYEMTAILAEDFGDYILQIAKEELPWREMASLEAQEQVDQVLEESIKMVKQYLNENQEFCPFAIGMLENGELSLIDMQEEKKQLTIILDKISDFIFGKNIKKDNYEAMMLNLIKHVKENTEKYIVVSIVMLTRMVNKYDIKILVEHREGVIIDERIPYEINGWFKKYVELGEKSVYRKDKFIWNEEEKVEE